jgi:hypothetical protein
MPLHFRTIDTPLRDLQVWHAESGGYSFAISHETRNRPGLRGDPGFIASWRATHSNKSAVAIDGSPFPTFEDAETACMFVLADLLAD